MRLSLKRRKRHSLLGTSFYCLLSVLALVNCFSVEVGAYTLQDAGLLRGCPFIHDDKNANDMAELGGLIRAQLKTKIEGNAKCEAAFRSISENFNSIDLSFKNNVDPGLTSDIKANILNQRLAQLEVDLMTKYSGSPEYIAIAAEIKSNRAAFNAGNADRMIARHSFSEKKTNEIMSSTFNNMNASIGALARMDPECLAQLGGWQTLLPMTLNMASSMSSFAGTTMFAAIGAGLKMLATLTQLLRDIRAKEALREIINYKNDKIIACTYYAVQSAACDYQRNLKVSQDYGKIKRIVQNRYTQSDTAIFDEYFKLMSHLSDFESIFFEISSMGSAITLDVDVMTRYFRAKRSAPESILGEDGVGKPPQDDDEGVNADARRQDWLIKVKARGIFFNERDAQGILKTLQQQIKEALTDIANKKADINSVESLVTRIRSFIDLKHKLDRDPSNIAKVESFRAYLDKVYHGGVVKTDTKGMIASAARIFDALKDFLAVKLDDFIGESGSPILAYDNYNKEVNRRGRILFERMSEGAVAQVDQQTVLTIGNIVQERLKRVFSMIEEAFYRDELDDSPDRLAPISLLKYSDYKRDHSIVFNTALNYNMFSGSGQTFRQEDAVVAMHSLEKGFHSEIRRLVSFALTNKSDIFPELKGTTAGHLCALFASSLKKGGLRNVRSRMLYKSCKKQFTRLGLFGTFEQNSLAIDWKDPCFYFKYQNIYETQRTLHENMMDFGFFNVN